MTKKELIELIAKATDKPIKQIDEMLAATVDCLVKAISKGDKLLIPGLGTFSLKKRKARTGINPRTQEKIKIAARKAPHFAASKAFKEVVNK